LLVWLLFGDFSNELERMGAIGMGKRLTIKSKQGKSEQGIKVKDCGWNGSRFNGIEEQFLNPIAKTVNGVMVVNRMEELWRNEGVMVEYAKAGT
jgi:hypothetical protein